MSSIEDDFTVPSGSPERADKVIAANFPETSRSLIKQCIIDGSITMSDGRRIDPKTKLFPGETLLLNITRPISKSHDPFDIKLDILYEDGDLIVVNKFSGMVVHPGDGTDNKTLVHALLHHLNGEYCPVGSPDRPGIVHRLDKETTGVMVVAKNEGSHHGLAKQFAERTVKKKYHALVTGTTELDSGFFDSPIGRHPKIRVKMCVSDKGKDAYTDWKVVERLSKEVTFMECSIRSGRTHQIRVHFSNAGHSLVGDISYGYNPNKYGFSAPPRIMLHASLLSFMHPRTKETITLEAPLHKDFKDFINNLKGGYQKKS